jgi:small-conductance mechanosensitive channel
MVNWIIKQTQHLLTVFGEIFTKDLFRVGGNEFSLNRLAQLLLLSAIAYFISRQVNEWIKRRLLGRLKFHIGTREAIASVMGYLLSALSFLIVLESAGIDLSSLTVVAGVLGIGIGFGLQNLASNFISGITLLFEQPIKVGDYIQVDDLFGTVEKISIRSTIVRSRDGVFVIVPNIRFVETNIINWSYQDPKCRLHIPVGIAYGTDPAGVTEALLTAARKEPDVLSDPPPKVWFQAFGDSALDFELLVWIDEPQNSDPIKSALNFRIECELRQRGIEIPFPQRDLHIRNLDSLKTLFKHQIPTVPSPETLSPSDHPPPQLEKAIPKSPNNWTLRDLLRRMPYFETCSDMELLHLIEYGYRQLFPGDRLICRENDPGDSFYIILSGSVEVFSQRLQKYIASLHAGEFFGEISLLMGIPRSASVRTLEDTILFVIDRNDLQRLLVTHRNLADRIAEKLSERQQSLKTLGLLVDEEIEGEEKPLIWIRKRLNTLFGI